MQGARATAWVAATAMAAVAAAFVAWHEFALRSTYDPVWNGAFAATYLACAASVAMAGGRRRWLLATPAVVAALGVATDGRAVPWDGALVFLAGGAVVPLAAIVAAPRRAANLVFAGATAALAVDVVSFDADAGVPVAAAAGSALLFLAAILGARSARPA